MFRISMIVLILTFAATQAALAVPAVTVHVPVQLSHVEDYQFGKVSCWIYPITFSSVAQAKSQPPSAALAANASDFRITNGAFSGIVDVILDTNQITKVKGYFCDLSLKYSTTFPWTAASDVPHDPNAPVIPAG